MTDSLQINIQKTAESRLPKIDFNELDFGTTFSDHMFIADYKNGTWTDLRIIPYQDFTISPANAALHYGQSIFEGLKAYKNKDGEALIFRPDANAQRMIKSAERMCMQPVPEAIFLEAIDQLVTLDKGWIPDVEGTSLYIRPFQFAEDSYIQVKASDTYKFIVFTGPVGRYYSEPIKVKIEKHYTRASIGGVGYAKTSGNYAASLFPAMKANEQGYHQLIWTDAATHEYIEESGTMNIMFVIGGTLITPPTSESILSGITRDSILTLANDWGLKVEERPIKVAEVINAIEKDILTEAFGIGTAATISHISTIGFEGSDYLLPPAEGRDISNRLLSELNKIKNGLIEDPHGWVRKIE